MQYPLPVDFRFRQLELTFSTLDAVSLGDNSGSALRGALFGGLRSSFCIPAGHPDEPDADCPACRLFATEQVAGARNAQQPRPVVIKPPARTEYGANELLVFGVGAVNGAIDLLPSLLAGAANTRLLGMNRGRVAFESARTVHPFDPDAPQPGDVTASDLAALAMRLPAAGPALTFLTPARLIEQGRLVHRPDLGVLVRRLVERVEALNGTGSLRTEYNALGALAGRATLVSDHTEWQDGWSGSRRTGRRSPVGGFTGTATWSGVDAALLPWLLTGSLIHVGKNAVKGAGWYRVEGQEH